MPATASLADEWLTVPQFASFLGVSDRTAARLLDNGTVPSSRPSVHRRVSVADAIAYRAKVTKRGRTRAVLHEVADDPLRD